MRVQREVERALGPDGGVGGSVPADERFVVPEAEFALPAIAAFGDWRGPVGGQLEDLSALVHLQGVGVDAGGSVFPGLPAGPPVTGEVQLVADLAGELGEGDAEGVGEGHGGGQDGLLLAGFVARELAQADVCSVR